MQGIGFPNRIRPSGRSQAVRRKDLFPGLVHRQNVGFLIEHHGRHRHRAQNKIHLRVAVVPVRNIARNPQRTDKLAVLIKDRRLISGELHHPVIRPLDFFLKTAGLTRLHDLLLGFQADKFTLAVFLWSDIPDVIMTAALTLLLCFAHQIAKALIDLQMSALRILYPYEIRHAVNHRIHDMLLHP